MMAEYILSKAIPINFLFIQNKTAKLIQWLQTMLKVIFYLDIKLSFIVPRQYRRLKFAIGGA